MRQTLRRLPIYSCLHPAVTFSMQRLECREYFVVIYVGVTLAHNACSLHMIVCNTICRLHYTRSVTHTIGKHGLILGADALHLQKSVIVFYAENVQVNSQLIFLVYFSWLPVTVCHYNYISLITQTTHG